MTSAAERLQRSQLSDQLEGLGYDVDLSELDLALKTRASLPVLEMVTAGTINRTIEGASTLSLTLRDRDRTVRRSGIIQAKTSVKVDGLWFRLVSCSDQGSDVTLTFEDREVNVLRSWPPPGTPLKDQFRLVNASALGKPFVARALFAKRLIDDVKGELAIRFVCPLLEGLPEIKTSRDRPSPEEKRQKKGPGFPAGAKLTMTDAGGRSTPATREQVLNTERVLDVGWSMREDPIILVASVMVIDQESAARNLPGGDADSRGIFQQRQSGGRPDGGSWPSSLDIETDAHAFFEVAEWTQQKFANDPDLPQQITKANVASFCSEIQRDHLWNTPQQGQQFAQSLNDALAAVALYLGDASLEPPDGKKPDTPKPAPQTFDDTGDNAFAFTRGTRTTVRGRKIFKREDNWACLQRLAEEVRKRCFCVSGTVYFMSEKELFGSAEITTIVEGTPGVRSIGGTFDIGQHNAQVTVTAMLDRWAAPPGSTLRIADTGIYDGKWLVATINRPIFNPIATIMLKKPRPALPETNSPEYGAGQTSGSDVFHGKRPKPKPKPPPIPPGPPPGGSALRNKIVEYARLALATESKWHYHYSHQRPVDFGLFSEQAHSPGIDCSAFVTLVYRAAGADDPNGTGYDGEAFTGLLASAGRKISEPGLGDLVLYGDVNSAGGHVGIYVGDGRVIEIGSENGILNEPTGYRTDIWGYVTIFPEGQ